MLESTEMWALEVQMKNHEPMSWNVSVLNLQRWGCPPEAGVAELLLSWVWSHTETWSCMLRASHPEKTVEYSEGSRMNKANSIRSVVKFGDAVGKAMAAKKSNKHV